MELHPAETDNLSVHACFPEERQLERLPRFDQKDKDSEQESQRVCHNIMGAAALQDRHDLIEEEEECEAPAEGSRNVGIAHV